MAYILGFMYADGNVVETKRGGRYIALYTADRHLLVAMRQSMGSQHKIARRTARSGLVYRIQIGSSEWFYDLEQHGMVPGKTKRMTLPHIPKQYVGDFVRGYFDGDGNVWVGFVHKERKTSLKTIQTVFTSGSFQYLNSLHEVLRQKGVVGGSLVVSKIAQFARLSFSVRDTFKLYKIMYNTPHQLCLKRKKIVFERFFGL